ncbi:MAG: hypothetical protein ACRDQX_10260 [Pseudonocardiaceae bacterium]
MAAGPEVWRAEPGLEPVWLEMLSTLGAVGGMDFLAALGFIRD